MDAALEYQNFTQPEEVENENFKVDSLETAEWCIKKIRYAEKQKAEARAYVEAETLRLQAWLKEINEKQDGDITYFTALLMPFAEEQLKDSKKKSFKCPSGDLMFRQPAPEYRRDEQKLLEFCKASAPNFVKVKESPDWAGLKKTLKYAGNGQMVTEDGEIVQGVEVIEKEIEFGVKVR